MTSLSIDIPSKKHTDSRTDSRTDGGFRCLETVKSYEKIYTCISQLNKATDGKPEQRIRQISSFFEVHADTLRS